MSNCCDHRRTFWGETFFEKTKNFFIRFPDSGRNCFGLLAKNSSRAFKTAVYVCRGWFQYCFSKKKFFSSILDLICWKLFSLCRKVFRQACQKCKPGVKVKNSWENNPWRRNKFFTIFVIWAKTFRTFVEKSLAGLSKLHSLCPEERLR